MTIKVVAGLINFNGKYFIGKRLFGEPAGKYEFPGGKIEPNETPENAIKREIKEELNVNIKVNRFLKTITYQYPTRSIELSLYLCTYIAGTIRLDSHSDYELINLVDLPKYQLAPADKEFIPFLLSTKL
jgi:8-oxo-dGTP diphosphatase